MFRSPTDKTRKDVHIMFPKQLSDKSKIQSALDSFQKEATAALSLNPDKSYKTPKLPHEIFQPPPSSAVQIAVLFYTFLAVWYAYCLRFSAVDPRILPKEVIPYRRFLADPAVFKSLATAVFAMNGAMALVAFGLTVFMARMPFKYVIKWVVSVIFFGLLQLRGCVKTSVKLGGILEQWHELTIS